MASSPRRRADRALDPLGAAVTAASEFPLPDGVLGSVDGPETTEGVPDVAGPDVG